MFDDFRLVTDLKTSDNVLLYGKSVIFGLDNKNMEVVKKGSELKRLAGANLLFSRIYVTSDVEMSVAGMAKLLSMNSGILSIFLNSQEHQDALVKYFENNYPWHETWVVDTNVGKILMTTAHGSPEWMD